MRRSHWRALLIVALALSCGGCVTPEALGQLRGFTPEDLIGTPQIETGVAAARAFALALAGTLCVFMCLVSGFHIYFGGGGDGQGGEAQRWSKGFLVWTVLSVVMIASMGANTWYSVDWVLRQLGAALGNVLKPDADPFAKWVEGVIQTNRLSLLLRDLLARGPQGDLEQKLLAAQAVAEWDSSWPGSTLRWLNSVGVLVMKVLLQVAYAWLLAFYTLVGPLAAACLMMPWTRRIFWGYCRTYLSLCLWPLLFGAAERVAQAVPFAYFFAVGRAALTSTDPSVVASALSQGAAMIMICNLLFFFVYLGIPVAASRLVNAAGTPFRHR